MTYFLDLLGGGCLYHFFISTSFLSLAFTVCYVTGLFSFVETRPKSVLCGNPVVRLVSVVCCCVTQSPRGWCQSEQTPAECERHLVCHYGRQGQRFQVSLPAVQVKVHDKLMDEVGSISTCWLANNKECFMLIDLLRVVNGKGRNKQNLSIQNISAYGNLL